MKSIPTINSAITVNTECSIVKACAPVIDLNVGVSLGDDPYWPKNYSYKYNRKQFHHAVFR